MIVSTELRPPDLSMMNLTHNVCTYTHSRMEKKTQVINNQHRLMDGSNRSPSHVSLEGFLKIRHEIYSDVSTREPNVSTNF